MKIIPREAGRITYSTEIRNLKKINFSEQQRAVIIGSILGDGCLCDNWSKTNSRLIISHSIDQKEYIEWKYEILKQWILTEPRYYDKNRSLTIRTISHPELTKLRDIFYVDGIKVIPNTISELIKNPLTLAVWFMDDGNVIKRAGKLLGFHINTQSFTENENKILVNELKKYYGFDSILEKNHNKYRLCISREKSRVIFADIVKPYIHESLLYKLGWICDSP